MRYGVNRLSVGIQTFSERGRKFYNRTYDKDEAIQRLKELQKFFKGVVCVDIIYNFPKETPEEVIADAQIVKELKISSASFYSLMVHEGSKLSQDIAEEKVKIEEDMKKDYLLFNSFAEEMLKDENYHILELTKIARKGGDDYKYIKVRNTGGDTFPIGVGAGGSVNGIGVFRMNKEISFYSKQTDYHKRFARLSGIMQFPIIPKKYVKDILTEKEFKYFQERMEMYQNKGVIITNGENYNLTLDGVFWGNNISNDIISYIVKKIFE